MSFDLTVAYLAKEASLEPPLSHLVYHLLALQIDMQKTFSTPFSPKPRPVGEQPTDYFHCCSSSVYVDPEVAAVGDEDTAATAILKAI